MSVTTDIEKLVRSLNQAWMESRYDDLYQYFHPDVAMLLPGSDKSIVGAEAMVESYREFGAMGKLHAFDIVAIESHTYTGVVICHLTFNVDYEIDSGRFTESGIETYAIDITGTHPKVVWRSQATVEDSDT